METQCKHSESVIKHQTNRDGQNTAAVHTYKEGPILTGPKTKPVSTKMH
jgi:hypothetical protein